VSRQQISGKTQADQSLIHLLLAFGSVIEACHLFFAHYGGRPIDFLTNYLPENRPAFYLRRFQKTLCSVMELLLLLRVPVY
jgi:hypothetical protein